MTFGLLALATTALATSGTFTALTFNVAGLPALFNGNEVAGDKATNAGILGKYFADYGYDLIQLQEVMPRSHPYPRFACHKWDGMED